MRFILALALILAGSLAAETKLGKSLTQKSAMPVAELMDQAEKYVDQTVQVKGKAVAVCQMAGCWIDLTDPVSQKRIRIKVDDGVIEFPKDAVGKNVLAEGKLVRLAAAKYQIQGTGAVILD